MSWQDGYGPGPDELVHMAALDANDRPTDYAACDEGDGTFPGGALALSTWEVSCPKCLGQRDTGTAEAGADDEH